MCACMLSCVQLFVTPWTVAHQAPLSMGFSRHEYQSGLPCPLPEDLSDPGIKPASLMSPALTGRFFTTSSTWEVQGLPILCQVSPNKNIERGHSCGKYKLQPSVVFTIRNQVLQSETHYFAIWMLYRYRQATLFLFLLGFILVIVLFPLGIQF